MALPGPSIPVRVEPVHPPAPVPKREPVQEPARPAAPEPEKTPA